MSWRRTTFLKLPRAALSRRDVVRRAVRYAPNAFDMTPEELAFARALLAVQSQLWLYRVNQRTFAGDFVVVDLSRARPSERPVFTVELKLGARLRVHDGTPVQLTNARAVVADIARTGVVTAECAPRLVSGDAAEVIAHVRRSIRGRARGRWGRS